MVSVSHTEHTIGGAAERLHADLARLEIQKKALERELAAVVAHRASVRRALHVLMPDPTAPLADRASLVLPSTGQYGRLTEQILAYLGGVGDTDVRARDVAAALGRDADSRSINAVRSTLDRLVAASRIRRTGRGLYRGVGA